MKEEHNKFLGFLCDVLLEKLEEESKFLNDLYAADRIEIQFSADMKTLTVWLQRKGGEDD